MIEGRIGWEIPGVYDGIAIWVEPDGTLTNRFEPGTIRYDKVQELLDFHETALQITGAGR